MPHCCFGTNCLLTLFLFFKPDVELSLADVADNVKRRQTPTYQDPQQSNPGIRFVLVHVAITISNI